MSILPTSHPMPASVLLAERRDEPRPGVRACPAQTIPPLVPPDDIGIELIAPDHLVRDHHNEAAAADPVRAAQGWIGWSRRRTYRADLSLSIEPANQQRAGVFAVKLDGR